MPGFQELIHRFERSISILGRSPSTFKNYSMHIAAIALHYGKIPTELDRIGGPARYQFLGYYQPTNLKGGPSAHAASYLRHPFA